MVGVERLLANKAGQLLLSSCSRSVVSGVSGGNSFLDISSVRFNSNRASICRPSRLQYLRQYPTVVVNTDGSTFTIRYSEPRHIIKLPVDITTLSEVDKQKHLGRRKPKTKVTIEEDYDDIRFDASKYLKLVKK